MSKSWNVQKCNKTQKFSSGGGTPRWTCCQSRRWCSCRGQVWLEHKWKFSADPGHFQSERSSSGRKVPIPAEKCHFRSKSVNTVKNCFSQSKTISGRKALFPASFPVRKCLFRLKDTISGRNVPLPVGMYHFWLECTMSGWNVSFPVGMYRFCHKIHIQISLWEQTIFIRKALFPVEKPLFQVEKRYFRSKIVISSRKAPFAVRMRHFRSETAIFS